MADHGHGHDDHDMDLLEGMGYEPRDMDLSRPTVSKVSIVFIAFIGFSFFVAWWFFVLYGRTTGFFKDPAQPVNIARRQLPPQVPLLQSNATAKKDMVALRKIEQDKLNATEWTDPAKTHAKISVESAINIVAQRGLPTRPGAQIPADYTDRVSAHPPTAPMQPPIDLPNTTGEHQNESTEKEVTHDNEEAGH